MASPSSKAVFITGCSRGIGLEFVKQFLCLSDPPEHVFATCRSPQDQSAEELHKLAAEHSNLHVLELDVEDCDAIKRVAAQVTELLKGKGLNLLVNNAARYKTLGIEDVTAEEMVNSFKTNTVAPLMIVKSLLPLLRRAASEAGSNSNVPQAAIVNISSKTASIDDNRSGGWYPSRASKVALNIITKSLSVDLKNDGITAIVVNPGWVKTRMGGSDAPLTVEESVSGVMVVIGSLDQSQTGTFFDYLGKILPW